MLSSMAFRKLPCILLGQIMSYFTSEVSVPIVRADELLHFRSFSSSSSYSTTALSVWLWLPL